MSGTVEGHDDSRAPVPASGLDHVGIAVPDLDEAARLYRRTFGAAVTEPVEIAEHGIRVAYVEFGNARLELMQPTRADSAVARFLDKNPRGGIHHLCLVTPDIPEASEAAAAAGLRTVAPPARGHHGRLLFFLHPAGTLGSLIEIEEPAAGAAGR